MNSLDSLRYRASLGDPVAKRRLSEMGKRGAEVRRQNRIWREWVLDQLHSKPKPEPDWHEPVMNQDGDMVPKGDME
jgi:hypothetical protein